MKNLRNDSGHSLRKGEMQNDFGQGKSEKELREKRKSEEQEESTRWAEMMEEEQRGKGQYYREAIEGIARALRNSDISAGQSAVTTMIELAMRMVIVSNNQRERCQICNNTGHMAKECPNRICQICNEMGHSARECPRMRSGITPEGERVIIYPAGIEDVTNCDVCQGNDHHVTDCPLIEELKALRNNGNVREQMQESQGDRGRRTRSLSEGTRRNYVRWNNGFQVGETVTRENVQ
jgi:hypothetical protein